MNAESPRLLPPRPSRNRWTTAAMIALASLAALGWTEATAVTHVTEMIATILRIKTPDGTLIVQVDDPTADIRVEADGKEIVITGAGVHEVRLRPGPHQLKVMQDGKPVREELITITRGGKQVARGRNARASTKPFLSRKRSGPDAQPHLTYFDNQATMHMMGRETGNRSNRVPSGTSRDDADDDGTWDGKRSETASGGMSEMMRMMMGRGTENAQPAPRNPAPPTPAPASSFGGNRADAKPNRSRDRCSYSTQRPV